MNTWKMEQMTASEIQNKIVTKKITVPKYQRGIVWKEIQKLELIDSIKKGMPFGSILLYKDEENNSYRLIDGLQRCNTIYEFISNPAKYFNIEDIHEESIVEICRLCNYANSIEMIKEQIIKLIIEWIKTEHKTMQEIIGMQFYECAEYIASRFPTLIDKKREVSELLKPMFKEYIQIAKTMSEAKIPAIVIMGNEDILPTVFERINSKGSQLTKWQIYAATWADTKIKINTDLQRIIQHNIDRYQDMLVSDDIELEDFDSTEMLRKKELNIFEVVYGFGKLISEDNPHLFNDSKKLVDVNSVGFNLLNACLGYKNNEIKNLNNNLRDIIGTDENINKFLKCVRECIRIVDYAIATTTKFKSNIRDNASPLHTEMQICSMIASVFINQYMKFKKNDNDEIYERVLDLDNINPDWKDFYEQFTTNCLKIYLIDILQANWRGSGDKKLNSIIINKSYYTREIKKQDMQQYLNLWFDMIKEERNEYQKIQAPREAEKLILNLIYSNIFTAQDQINDSKYDIEHIATKNCMKKQLKRFDGKLRLPISAVSNLCLLPEDINRKKGEKTIYQSNECQEIVDELEKKYTFTTKQDLAWIENSDLTIEELKKSYTDFIDTRFETIKQKLIEVLF